MKQGTKSIVKGVDAKTLLSDPGNILSLNREFFEKTAIALAQTRLFSAVDIQKIKSECEIVPVIL